MLNNRYFLSLELETSLYGEVGLYRDTASDHGNDYVAIKRIDLRKLHTDEHQENPQQESRIQRKLNRFGDHPNILSLHDQFTQDHDLYFVYEYCERGDLFGLVSTQNYVTKISQPRIQLLFSQIIAGVAHIHKKGYAHRDLSLENILLTAQDQVKIADFGLATKAFKRQTNLVGKPLYSAPEMYQKGSYLPIQADIWSLGITLLLLLCGRPAFMRATEDDISYRFFREHGIEAFFEKWGLLPRIDPDAIHLLKQLLVVNPQERLSIDKILQHPWILDSARDIELSCRDRKVPCVVVQFLRKVISKATHRPSSRSIPSDNTLVIAA